MLVSRDADGSLSKTSIPLGYAYTFAAAAVVGLFTLTGLAGSYTRMLVKTERFNQLRQDHNRLQSDYAHLEKNGARPRGPGRVPLVRSRPRSQPCMA